MGYFIFYLAFSITTLSLGYFFAYRHYFVLSHHFENVVLYILLFSLFFGGKSVKIRSSLFTYLLTYSLKC